MTADAEVRVERRGGAGFLILNRIAALNALTLRMVREISAALDEFWAPVFRAWNKDSHHTAGGMQGGGGGFFHGIGGP